jgi:hypothetical protein
MTQNTMARRVGRPRGLTESRIDKRYIIAGALLAGIKIAAVARQLGVSRSWASREANAPGTRQLLADLFELHRERMNALFDQTLDVIEDAMKARQFLVVNRVVVDVGPDHYARLEAVKMFTLLMRHAGNGRRYIQVPGASGIGVNEPRGVPAANAAAASNRSELMVGKPTRCRAVAPNSRAQTRV